VSAFNSLIRTGVEADLLRYDGAVIDPGGDVIGLCPNNVDGECAFEYAYGRLMGWRGVFMQQLIFRRSAFAASGSFLDLPLGWFTDDALVVALTRRRPLRRIPGARVYWRASTVNMTPNASLKSRGAKVRATCLFLRWLNDRLAEDRALLFGNDDVAFRRLMNRTLSQAVTLEGALPALFNWRLLAQTSRGVCGTRPSALVKYLVAAAACGILSSVEDGARRLLRCTGRLSR
jgi:hypothetical protein